MAERMDISVERIYGSGALRLTTIYGERYFTELFMGYTKRQALTNFRASVKGQVS
jgi:hypothetical protein